MIKKCVMCGKEFEFKQNNRKYCSYECSKIGYRMAINKWNKSEKGEEASKRYYERKGRKPKISIVKEILGLDNNPESLTRFRKEHPEEFIKLPPGIYNTNCKAYLETNTLMYCNGISKGIQRAIPKIMDRIGKKLVNQELTQEDLDLLNKRRIKKMGLGPIKEIKNILKENRRYI